jgi:hypothetical protein
MRLVTAALATLLLVAAACGGAPARPTVLPAKLGHAHKIEGAPPANAVVEVEGRTSVWVFQGGEVRAIIEWPKEGKGRVPIPLGALDNGKGQPIFVAVTSDQGNPKMSLPLLRDLPRSVMDEFYCIRCQPDPQALGGCCPPPPPPDSIVFVPWPGMTPRLPDGDVTRPPVAP